MLSLQILSFAKYLAWLLRKPTRTIKDLARSSNFKEDVVDTRKKCKFICLAIWSEHTRAIANEIATGWISATADMEFVKKITPPDFQAKNFTPSISPYFNSFRKKKHKKLVKMEKFTLLATNFTLPPGLTGWTNYTSEFHWIHLNPSSHHIVSSSSYIWNIIDMICIFVMSCIQDWVIKGEYSDPPLSR